MKTTNQNKIWLPIKDFMKKVEIKKREVYQRLNEREWYDGYVVKKTPTNRIKWGCIEDYDNWVNKL